MLFINFDTLYVQRKSKVKEVANREADLALLEVLRVLNDSKDQSEQPSATDAVGVSDPIHRGSPVAIVATSPKETVTTSDAGVHCSSHSSTQIDSIYRMPLHSSPSAQLDTSPPYMSVHLTISPTSRLLATHHLAYLQLAHCTLYVLKGAVLMVTMMLRHLGSHSTVHALLYAPI